MKKSVLGRLFSPFGITQLVMVAAVGVALWLAYGPWRADRFKEEIRSRHPYVARIDAGALKEWLGRRAGPKPVVIDVRPQAEFDFSHIPGARHMALSDTPATAGIGDKDDAPFVICDAAGSDSFSVAASLSQLGYRRLQVLEGGIFDWANKGYPLENRDGPVDKVKAGPSRYVNLLNRSRRAP